MIIDCISDLHGFYQKLEGGDLLIIAGDLTASGKSHQYIEFYKWLQKQEYKKKIVVPGNHDNYFQKCNEFSPSPFSEELATYLCDSGAEFEGLKIWDSPWTSQFAGINPHCCAFTIPYGYDAEEHLAEKWTLIPNDTDILITHSPSFGNHDWIKNRDGSIGPSVGSLSLWLKCLEIRPKLHVFGHIHEAYGHSQHNNGIRLVNASVVNEIYKPVNKPVRITL